MEYPTLHCIMKRYKWADSEDIRNKWYACLDVHTHRLIFIGIWRVDNLEGVIDFISRRENHMHPNRGKILLKGMIKNACRKK